MIDKGKEGDRSQITWSQEDRAQITWSQEDRAQITWNQEDRAQITLDDVFQDYNDPRKELLQHRVTLLLQQHQQQLQALLDANNLTNLHLMLKKQHRLQKLEQVIAEKEQQQQELTQQLLLARETIGELQGEVGRQAQLAELTQQQFGELSASLRSLESVVCSKDDCQ